VQRLHGDESADNQGWKLPCPKNVYINEIGEWWKQNDKH
jgi:hypothetical protein